MKKNKTIAHQHKTICQLIQERDEAQEAVSEIYFRIIGKSPEWSNLFGHAQAVEEIVETFDTVRACLKVWRKD